MPLHDKEEAFLRSKGRGRNLKCTISPKIDNIFPEDMGIKRKTGFITRGKAKKIVFLC